MLGPVKKNVLCLKMAFKTCRAQSEPVPQLVCCTKDSNRPCKLWAKGGSKNRHTHMFAISEKGILGFPRIHGLAMLRVVSHLNSIRTRASTPSKPPMQSTNSGEALLPEFRFGLYSLGFRPFLDLKNFLGGSFEWETKSLVTFLASPLHRKEVLVVCAKAYVGDPFWGFSHPFDGK